MIIEVKRRDHVQRMTYDEFEARIQDGEIAADTPVRFDAVTGELISFDSGFAGHSSDPLTLELLCEWLSD